MGEKKGSDGLLAASDGTRRNEVWTPRIKKDGTKRRGRGEH